MAGSGSGWGVSQVLGGWAVGASRGGFRATYGLQIVRTLDERKGV